MEITYHEAAPVTGDTSIVPNNVLHASIRQFIERRGRVQEYYIMKLHGNCIQLALDNGSRVDVRYKY